MMASNRAGRRQPFSLKQGGLVLFIALIVLVVMSLVGVSLMRHMGSSQMIAGNLAFKASVTAGADRGTESGRVYVRDAATTTLEQNQSGFGYFASTAVAFDPATYNWDANNAAVEDVAADASGNRVQHVIHRLCPAIGPSESQACVSFQDPDLNPKGGQDYGNPGLPPPLRPYFRITTKVTGPRNSTSYTQVILY